MRFNPCIALATVPMSDGDIAITAAPVSATKAKSAAPPETPAVNPPAGPITLTINEKRQLVELRFPGKPDDATRAQLKAARFRWYGPAGCWYHKHTPENHQWAAQFIASQAAGGNAPAAPAAPLTVAEKLRAAEAHLQSLAHFMGPAQQAVVRQNFKGEEREYFFEKVRELAERVANMPETYGQDGKGRQAIAYLHYFAGGQGNWWITEKDQGCAEDEGGPHAVSPGGPHAVSGQHQAFGLADLFGDGGELGYISIAELIAHGAELDFHFTPATLAAIQGDEPAPVETTNIAATITPAEPVTVPSTAAVPAWRRRCAR